MDSHQVVSTSWDTRKKTKYSKCSDFVREPRVRTVTCLNIFQIHCTGQRLFYYWNHRSGMMSWNVTLKIKTMGRGDSSGRKIFKKMKI
jgi:hypothetical protein